jgi:hypothetical protein
MLCTLLLPDLFLPRAVHADAYRGLHLPALERLLSRSDSATLPGQSYEAWLCQAFGVAPQPDWPVAALTLAVDRGDDNDEGFWLRADPVHLRATRDRVLLSDASVLSIQPEEADTLVAALNAYFADDTRHFFAPHPQRWYLRLNDHPQIATRTLLEAIGKDIHPLLPAGPQALYWHRMANEIQMLLHAHAVNEARGERGDPTINSVWLWGGGHRPTPSTGGFHGVWSKDALALGLARNAGLRTAPTGDAPGPWLGSVAREERDKHYLVVLDQLMLPARHGDLPLWRERLAQLEQEWFAPLLRAMRERRVARLIVAATGPDRSIRFEVTPLGLLRVWRAGATLAAHAATHAP